MAEDAASWRLERTLVEHLESRWEAPDRGFWEVRSAPGRFTHSKVMAWVAFDRAAKAVERCGLEGPLERWRALRDPIHAEVCEQAFDRELNAFTRAYGTRGLDASALLIPLVVFLPADDPACWARSKPSAQSSPSTASSCATTARDVDGLPPGEGAFLPCTFWLVDNLVLQGRHAGGEALLERLLSVRNDLGLLSEEYDPALGGSWATSRRRCRTWRSSTPRSTWSAAPPGSAPRPRTEPEPPRREADTMK